MCPTTLSSQWIFSKITANIHWTILQTPLYFSSHFAEHDLCSRCGGGGQGIHHRSAHDRTLLVSIENLYCCCDFVRCQTNLFDVCKVVFKRCIFKLITCSTCSKRSFIVHLRCKYQVSISNGYWFTDICLSHWFEWENSTLTHKIQTWRCSDKFEVRKYPYETVWPLKVLVVFNRGVNRSEMGPLDPVVSKLYAYLSENPLISI